MDPDRRKKRGRLRRIKLNWPWWLFYGYQIGMSRQEVLSTPYGEMRDLLSCLSIYQGTAEQAEDKTGEYVPMEEVLEMR